MPVNRERFLADFLELVRIPSPSGKEKEVARAVRAKLESMGLTVTEDNAGEKFGGEQGNLIVKVQGNLEGVPADYVQRSLGYRRPLRKCQPNR
jgi:tripeptide aminopeptidase